MKDYKKILEGVVNIINTAEKSDIGFANICTYIGENCPELKESDDKMMIQYFKDLAPFDKADELYEKYGFSHKDAIVWLEKQCEQKIKTPEESLGIDSDTYNKIVDECIYGEQKPTDTENGAKWNDREIPNSAWSEADETMWAEISELLWEGYKQSCSKFYWYDIRNWVNHKLKSLRPQKQCCNDVPSIEYILNVWELGNYWKELTNGVCSTEHGTQLEYIQNHWKEGEYYDKIIVCPQKQWKPSDEQMEALKDALNDAIWQYDYKGSMIKEEVTRKHAEIIESLYNDLKKIKGE